MPPAAAAVPAAVAATAATAAVATAGAAGVAAGVAAATAAAAGAFSIGSIVTGTLISAALSTVSSLLLAPKPGDFSKGGQTLSFRAAAAAAQIVYGRTRTGGPILFMTTTGGERPNDNQYLWVVAALTGHPVHAITDVYFSDEIIALNPESGPPSPFGNPWFGNATEAARDAPGGGLGEGWGKALVIKRLGTYDQTVNPNWMPRATPLAWENLKYFDIVSEADTLKGIAHLSATFAFVPDLFPGGAPNMSAVVEGRIVYDPREPSHDINDPLTWEWSDNAALCVADYIRGCPFLTDDGVVTRPYGLQAADDEIDWDDVIAAANICDESVQKLDGGFEPRYTCNGTLDSDASPDEAIKALLSSMAGYLAYSGGKWRIFAGAYRTPVATFHDDDQCGPSRTQARRARRDLFNGVKGKFRGPRTFYQATDFPSVGGLKQTPTFVEQDNGEEIWQDVELPFTDGASACQRIARIDLERNRQQIVTERRFKLTALGTQAGDIILLNDPRKGWVDKPFEIHTWALTSERDDQGQPFWCIDMTLHETSSGVYAWTADDEYAFDDAPDTNLPRPYDVAVPGQPGIVEELYSTRDGSGVKTKVTVSWTSAFEAFLLDYTVEYKLSSGTEWAVLPPVTGTSIEIFDVAAGLYDFRVRTRNRLGVTSDYSTSEGLTVYGLGAVPATLTGLGIQPLGNQAMLAWTQSVDLDVREGGRIEFRQSPAFSGVTWENSTSIREAVPGGATSATVPLKAGTYVLRPVDSSGITGDITTVSSKQANVAGYTSLAGSPVTEETAFSGSHSFTIGTGSVLKLSNDGLWDDIADLDAEAGNIDDLGGLSLSGTYTFDNEYDFGAVTNVRLTSHIAATATDLTSGTIDDRAELIDDWETFDGTTLGGVADAWVEYRQTDDNPAGSPTWSEWMRLDTAEAECRAVQFRCQLRSFDDAFNIEITELQVAAEALT